MMLELDTHDVKGIFQSDWLYGFILHYLQIRGEINKRDLMARVQADVKYTFPNLDQDYFREEYSNSNNVFVTLFYFAIFHLREKGYGLIHQKVKKNEPMISLSPVGYEFLKTPGGKPIFIDYRDIENFLKLRYPKLYKRAVEQVENYRNEISKMRLKEEGAKNKWSPAGNKGTEGLLDRLLGSVKMIDIILIVFACLILILLISLPGPFL